MAALAPITINDGQTTPVSHSFVPVIVDAAGVAMYEDRILGISIGFPKITASVRRPVKGSANYRVVQKITVPVMEVTAPSTSTGIQPAPTKAYDMRANVEFILPERCTLQDRKDLLAYVKNLLAHATTLSAVTNFEHVW